MVSTGAGLLAVLVTAILHVQVSAAGDCKSIFCFSIFSRKIDVKVNLFDDAVPLPIEEHVARMGYRLENHDITTEDGYILRYHRIPYGKSGPQQSLRPPVLLQHGLLAASSAWLLSNHSLGYTLADAGFDVWLGNARGNTYSRRHIKYDPDKDENEFWDFSWHEMGYYDLPASIDYILNVTGHERLFYIGHSMGTTMYFVLGATRPEYMHKIHAMVALAPVAFPWNVRSSLANYLNKLHFILNGMASVFGISEVFRHSDSMFWIDRNICAKEQFKFICKETMKIAGFGEKDLNRTSLLTVLQYMPAGTSYKQLRHFRQIADRGSGFQKFDYGLWGNLRKYCSFYPPTYDLSSVKSPIYVYYGMNDWLSVPEIWVLSIDNYTLMIVSNYIQDSLYAANGMTCTAERLFSTKKWVKNILRNKMGTYSLSTTGKYQMSGPLPKFFPGYVLDVYHAVEKLPNVQKVTPVPDDQFNHLDFMWSVDARTLLYNDIISTLHNLTTH